MLKLLPPSKVYSKTRSEKDGIATDSTNINRVIQEYYEHYTNKFDNNDATHSLENTNSQSSLKKK